MLAAENQKSLPTLRQGKPGASEFLLQSQLLQMNSQGPSGA